MLENHLFSGSGATFPTSNDFPRFASDGGDFVIWDPVTGAIFEKCQGAHGTAR